eukprot:1194555-Prorocentrum_minimum.AAC.3
MGCCLPPRGLGLLQCCQQPWTVASLLPLYKGGGWVGVVLVLVAFAGTVCCVLRSLAAAPFA